MYITVNQQSEETRKPINVSWEELTEENQAKVFLAHKDDFLFQALTSSYGSVRTLAKQHINSCSLESLYTAIHRLEFLGEVRKVIELLDVPIELTPSLRDFLSHSMYWEIRLWIANNISTPAELLSNMFLLESTSCIKEAIMQNPNFDCSPLP